MRRAALVVILVACALASSASAAPAGFTENAALNARAAWVAGKLVHVYCAKSYDAWQAYITSSGATAGAADTYGVTPIVGGDVTYLAQETCAPILARLHKRPVTLLALGGALDVLAHESLHMRGESDEGQTECKAIRTLPAYLVARWGFRKNSTAYLRVVRGAQNYHAALPDQYRAVC